MHVANQTLPPHSTLIRSLSDQLAGHTIHCGPISHKSVLPLASEALLDSVSAQPNLYSANISRNSQSSSFPYLSAINSFRRAFSFFSRSSISASHSANLFASHLSTLCVVRWPLILPNWSNDSRWSLYCFPSPPTDAASLWWSGLQDLGHCLP